MLFRFVHRHRALFSTSATSSGLPVRAASPVTPRPTGISSGSIGGGSMMGKGCHPLSAALFLKQVEGVARKLAMKYAGGETPEAVAEVMRSVADGDTWIFRMAPRS